MSRAVWILTASALLVAGLQLAPPSTATTASTSVEVANAAPTIEAHRVSTVPEAGAWTAWVWVSDANGIEDLDRVELRQHGRVLAAAEEPSWTADGVARFTIEVPDAGQAPAGSELRVEDSGGAGDTVAFEPSIDAAPAKLSGDVAGELRSVPGPGLAGLVAVLAVLLSGRGARRAPSRAPPGR